jgi:hypothetical protein
MRISLAFFLSWPQAMIFLISASQEARCEPLAPDWYCFLTSWLEEVCCIYFDLAKIKYDIVYTVNFEE